MVDRVDVRTTPWSGCASSWRCAAAGGAFSGTLEENMRWGNENATQADRQPCGWPQAEEFVSKLPDGWQTKIAQGGKNLSGGQRQRLTIARALVREPKSSFWMTAPALWILPLTRLCANPCRRETQGMTVIMVSLAGPHHPPGQIRSLSWMMERGGRVGTHDELSRDAKPIGRSSSPSRKRRR